MCFLLVVLLGRVVQEFMVKVTVRIQIIRDILQLLDVEGDLKGVCLGDMGHGQLLPGVMPRDGPGTCDKDIVTRDWVGEGDVDIVLRNHQDSVVGVRVRFVDRGRQGRRRGIGAKMGRKGGREQVQ